MKFMAQSMQTVTNIMAKVTMTIIFVIAACMRLHCFV